MLRVAEAAFVPCVRLAPELEKSGHFTKCFLCHQLTKKRTTAGAEWEVQWFQNCFVSLCQLLDLDDFNPSFFEAGDYCSKCTVLLRDIDFTVRTLSSLQHRASKARAQVAKFLLSRLETGSLDLGECGDEDENQMDNAEDAINSEVMTTEIPSPGSTQTPNLESRCCEDGEDALSELTPVPCGSSQQHEQNLDQIFSLLENSKVIPNDGVLPDMPIMPLRKSCKKAVPKKPSERLPTHSSKRRRQTRFSYRDEESDNDFEDNQNLENQEDLEEWVPEEGTVHTIVSPIETSPKEKGHPRVITRKRKRTKKVKASTNTGIDEPKSSTVSKSTANLPVGISGISEAEFIAQLALSLRKGKSAQKINELLQSYVHHLIGNSEMEESSTPEEWSQEELLLHLLRCELEAIEDSYSIVCPASSCGRRFSKTAGLHCHYRRDHGKELDLFPFQCFVCDKRQVSGLILDAHLRRIHGKEKCPCECEFPGCVRKFAEPRKLIEHVRIVHPQMDSVDSSLGVNGQNCFLTYRDKVTMAKGKTRCGGSHVYCPEEGCVFRSRNATGMEFHRRKHHLKEARPYACTFCGRSYSSKNGYDRHPCPNNKVNNAHPQCEYCGKKCPSYHTLRIHKAKAHADTVTPYPCTICQRVYYDPAEVAKHEKRHTEETGYNCVVVGCNEPHFDTLEGLRAHVTGSSHDMTQNTKVCEVCAYTVHGDRANARMKQHMMKHTGESPHKCRFCDKRFKTLMTKKSHEEINHPDLVEKKIYPCKQCDKTFTVAQYLFKHYAWHKHGTNACRPVARKRPIE